MNIFEVTAFSTKHILDEMCIEVLANSIRTSVLCYRLSLDPSDSRQSTTVSQFSSVSQPVRYSSQSKHFQSLARSHGQSTDQSCDSLDDTLTDLDSITLGSPAGIKRTDSQTGVSVVSYWG